MDYTLEIDFDVFTDEEIKTVLSILCHSSSLCFEDIRILGSNLILRMERVGFNLRLKENRVLAKAIIDTFNILKKINSKPTSLIYEIYEKYNYYMFSKLPQSPISSPVQSPKINAPPIISEEQKEPTIMKKTYRRIVKNKD